MKLKELLIVSLTALPLALFGLSGCEDDGLDEVGDDIEDAAEDTGDAIKDAVN